MPSYHFESTSNLFVTWEETKAFILEGKFAANNVAGGKDVLLMKGEGGVWLGGCQ